MIYFNDQQAEFKMHLQKLKELNVLPYSKEKLKHKISKQVIRKSFDDLNWSHFFNYKIFPENILKSYTQWSDENRKIKINDTILQQIHLPPFSGLSSKMIAGVRICSIKGESDIKEFAYETLRGHVERGISIFRFERSNDYSLFTIETFSSPAMSLLKLFQPITSLYQDYCTKKALNNVEENY